MPHPFDNFVMCNCACDNLTTEVLKMKTAIVTTDRTGYWVVIDDNGKQVGGYHSTELQAYKAANSDGYLVR